MQRDLRPLGPFEVIDRALLLVRRGGLALALRPVAGGLVLAAAVLGAYYVERVEGLRSLRLLIAFALVLAWWARALLLASAARSAVMLLWSRDQIPEGAGRPVDVLRTSSVVAVGLWFWLWLLVAASWIGTFAIPFLLPILALRGAVAPSWIARAGCTTEGGLRAFWKSITDSNGRRVYSICIEFSVLVGSVALALNLFATIAVFMLLGRSMLGLDVAFIDSFLSVRNTFVLLVVGALALALLEPLRVALSAVHYVDGRVRQEGLDLRAAVHEAIEAAERRGGITARSSPGTERSPGGAGKSAAVLALAFALGSVAPAEAQPPEPSPIEMQPLPSGTGPDGVAPSPDPQSWDPTGSGMPPKQPVDFESLAAGGGGDPATDAEDEQVRAEVRDILEQPEFQEFADTRGRGIRQLLERLLEWLLRDREVPNTGFGQGRFGIPMPPAAVFLVLGGVLLIAVLLYLIVTRSRSRRDAAGSGAVADEAEDPRERAPEAHLDDAALLARDGRYRDALRSLYVATLVALDRRRMISFDPALTNWQYIRPMPRGDVRADFARFTRLFDYKWYGDEATTEADYRTCRELADRIVRSAAGAREAA